MRLADPATLEIGDRIRLIDMPNDPDPIPAGTEGTVEAVTDLHFRDKPEYQLIVKWDNGRRLSCICPPDLVELVQRKESVTQ